MLDPRLKDKWYAAVKWKSCWIRAAQKDVRELWTSFYKLNKSVSEEPNNEPPQKKSRNSVLAKITAQMKNIKSVDPEDELTRYLRDPVVPDESLSQETSPVQDVLTWWKVRGLIYFYFQNSAHFCAPILI